MTENEYILIARNLHKTFGRGQAAVQVLRGLGLAVRRGEFLAVSGPSGCGKSTLLHVLGLITPVDMAPSPDGRAPKPAGEILFDGRSVPQDESARTVIRRRSIGFVFQRFNLIGVLSAVDNVAISLRVRGLRDDGRAAELFERMGVAHVMRRKPSRMSIGEQQRVAVVRALAHRPAMVLADEPTGNLDSRNAQGLLGLFRQLNQQDGQTIVMITHSAEAAARADRVVHMQDGRILDDNP